MARRRLRHRIRAWFNNRRADKLGYPRPLGHWNTRPTLMLSADLEDAHERAVYKAVGWWHEELGRQLFTTVNGVDPKHTALQGFAPWQIPEVRGLVSVVSEAPYSPEARAHAEMFRPPPGTRGGEIYGGQVRIRPGLDDKHLVRSVAHELGHVLGLAHPIGSDNAYLMDIDGTGFNLLKQERAHAQCSP